MSDDRHLSGEEKRAKLREEYKRELMLRKEMEQRAAGAQRMGKLQSEIDKLEALISGDDTEDWTNKLNETAALAEAKLEMALGLTDPPAPTPAPPAAEHLPPTAPATKGKTLGDDSTAHPPAPGDTGPVDNPDVPTRRKTLGDL